MNRNCVTLFLLFASAWSGFGESFPLGKDGAIGVWTLAGPLPYDAVDPDAEKPGGYFCDFLKASGGEAGISPSEGDSIEVEGRGPIMWSNALTDPHGVLDFCVCFEVGGAFKGIGYAYCELESDVEQKVLLLVRSNDGCRAWLNGERILDRKVPRTLDMGADHVPVTLKKGTNRLLCKVDQLGGAWGLAVQVSRAGGATGAAQGLPLARAGALKGIRTVTRSSQKMVGKIISANISALPLVLKTPEGERQVLTAEIVSGGLESVVCQISSPGWKEPRVFEIGDLPFGTQKIDLNVPPVTQDTRVDVSLRSSSDEKTWQNVLVPKPRRWTVYLVQHVHTDIGYTRPQTEILPEHLRYIDYALDYCDLTDDYPDDSKFRWTCEISWAVREYVKRRPPEQIERLKRRIEEGRIEICGMFLNMAEIADEASLAASLQPLREFKDVYGIPVRSTMQNDVNGAAWCLPDYFSSIGIRYLAMGINKTRSLLPFDVPTPFWWESPSGKRVLALRADHYHTGNACKIHLGNVGIFRTNLLNYLVDLERRGYPFDRVSVQHSGYHTDNSPPALIESRLAKEWNEKYAWPKLRVATVQEFLEYIETNHSDELPVHRQAWPDWWTDGFGSAARETAASRKTHSGMHTNQGLLAMAAMLGAELPAGVMDRAAGVQEDLLFYDEHTYGAAESISDPMAENTMVQWGQKSSYAWDAVKDGRMLREEALGLLQDFVPRSDVPTVAVFNTLNWSRSGVFEVFIDSEILPRDKEFRIVDPVSGEAIPAQVLGGRAEGNYWALWVTDVPALGYKLYRIEVEENPRENVSGGVASVNSLENEFYRVTIDSKSGAIESLFDKEMKLELVDQESPWKLGQLVYETLPEGRELILGSFQRTSLESVEVEPARVGPVWRSIGIRGKMRGCAGIRVEIRLYGTEKRIEIHCSLRKLPVTAAEAVYVTLPFQWQEGEILYEAQGGTVRPGKDQIPRTASDWCTMQNFVSVRNWRGQIIMSCDEAPLVQFGGFNLGKWMEISKVEKPHVFSYVMNNYWFTNFRATQEGELKWSYHLTSTRETDNAVAARFGWGVRVPLASRVLPPGEANASLPSSYSALELDVPNLVLIDARPAYHDESVIMQFREVNGKKAQIDWRSEALRSRVTKVDEVDVIEQTVRKNIKELVFEPYEVKFVKVKL